MDIVMFSIKLFLGFIGTLIVVFLRLTGALPRSWFELDSKLKNADVTDINNRIKTLEERSANRDKAIEDARKTMDITKESSPARISEFEAHLESYRMQMENDSKELESLRKSKADLEKEIKSSSWKNWTMATVLYVVIGSTLAAFLAPTPATQTGELVVSDVWQVILWGGGWVAFVSLADFSKLDSKKKEIWTQTMGDFEKEVEKKSAEAKTATDTANVILAQNEKLKDLVMDLTDALKKIKT